ncbi:MAG: autotransporter outer membrane beta-barrel domain-containing protein [Alphaproteobacteria bacterium]|nr:autotransporter outer membrane beta-barrel domain-containing protein [Alphaproteobacteria bacterium]
MSISLKKILFAGTALVAMNYAAPAYAQCVTNGAPGTVTIASGNCVTIDTDPAASTAISFTGGEGGDPTAYVDPGVDITGKVVTDTNGVGYLNIEGSTTVSGKVGAAGLALNQIWAGAEGATDTFSGDVFAQDIDVGFGTVNFNGNVNVTSETTFQFQGAGTANFNGNMLTGNIDFNAYSGEVNFADGANMTGDIYDAGEGGPGYGTVNFDGSSNIDGSIGADGYEINAINFNGGAGSIVNISGDIGTIDFTTSVNGLGTANIGGDNIDGHLLFDADGTVNWNFAGPEPTFNGNIDSDGFAVGDGIGSMNFNGDEVNSADIFMDGNFGNGGVLNSFTLAGENNTLWVNGSFDAADNNTLGVNIVNVYGDFFIGTGEGGPQTLNTTIFNNEGGIGRIYGDLDNNDNTSTVESGVIVNITVDTYDYVGEGDTYTIVTANNVDSNDIGTVDVTDTALLDYEQTFPNDDDLVVEIAGRANISDLLGGEDGDLGDSIEGLCNEGCDGPLGDFVNRLLNAADEAALRDVIDSAKPDVTGAGTDSALDTNEAFLDKTEEQLAARRSGETMSGMAAGTAANGASMWIQGYGQKAQQDFRDGVDGYDSHTLGTAIGADSTNIIDGVLGLAFNYAQSNIDSNNINTTDTDVKDYGVTLYGSHDFGDDVFMNAQIGYAYNTIDSTRHNAGAPGLWANADYNSDQYAAKALLGHDYAATDGLTLTPSVSAAYTYLKTEGYTETGTGTLLVVDDASYNSLKLGARINAEWNLKNADGAKMKPSIYVGYAYDTIGDNIDETANFVGGGASFNTTGADPARSSGTAGAAFTFTTTANWDLTAKYDYTYKADYDSHAGLIRATAHF